MNKLQLIYNEGIKNLEPKPNGYKYYVGGIENL